MKQGFMLTKDEVLGIYNEIGIIANATNNINESKETLTIKGCCSRIMDILKPEDCNKEKENDV